MSFRITNFYLVLSLIFTLSSCSENKPKEPYPEKITQISPELAAELNSKIREEVAVEIADDLELFLWAADTLVNDPVAISIDENGRIYYTHARRLEHSEFDIRSHRDWMTASISFQTPEDRRAFLRKTFSETNEVGERFLKDLNKDGVLDWRDLTVEKEQIWLVSDTDLDGNADRSQLFIEDFHDEITDLANGVEYFDGKVFLSVGPDLWRIEDTDANDIANKKESLSHGFAVHIGFGAHGMSGVTVGPQGRIWWGIGDIGMNVVDKDGKRWKYPNQGVIVRCDPDGSNFEVYCAGLRNTHEFVFDEYGNLISEDNDGDHKGERERLVYLINGSDTGWRINWQFGKYTDPNNNGYKVWMDEKMSVPRWDGQAAYFLPPIINYVNGPTGMVYNPGTALSEKYRNHFFISEFRGTPAHSPIHAFTLKPKGASFELDTTFEVAKGLLPTGLDFGPDGALYFGDWIDGWGVKNEGRIWKLDVPDGENSEIRKEVKQLIATDFSKLNESELGNYLGHQDMRIRRKTQFELVKRGESGFNTFLNVAKQNANQLARIHSLWGMTQMARTIDKKYGAAILPFLKDEDPEIITQAAKMLGDVKYAEAGDDLLTVLKNPSLRVQMHVIEALGRIKFKPAVQTILDVLLENNGEDAWLRHAGMVALGRIGDEKAMIDLHTHESKVLRTVAVVALRRMKSAGVAKFLNDVDEYIVTEAARAINDDFSIVDALPDLARILISDGFQNEALIRRAINANLRVGEAENIGILLKYAQNKTAPPAMRAEALATLSSWGNSSELDRVDGRYRGKIERDDIPVKKVINPVIANLLTENNPEIQIAATKVVAKLNLAKKGVELFDLVQNSSSPKVRKAALEAMNEINAKDLDQALEIAINDKAKEVRSAALKILPESNIEVEKAVVLFEKVLEKGTILEQQAAYTALGNLKHSKAIDVLEKALNQIVVGKMILETQLDVIEAIETQNSDALNQKLKTYQDSKDQNSSIASFTATLAGGDAKNGEQLFYNHEAAQCTRCHSIFEMGGNAGPGLAGLGNRLSKEQILESMVDPSAVLAKGYAIVYIKTKKGESISGTVLDENAEMMKLKVGKEGIREIDKNKIESVENIPSSMPPMGSLLSKREIRDLIAFLSSLEE